MLTLFIICCAVVVGVLVYEIKRGYPNEKDQGR